VALSQTNLRQNSHLQGFFPMSACRICQLLSVALASFLAVCPVAAQDTTEFVPQIAENAKVPDGFKIEKIFHVPSSMGSWVSLAADPKGRIVASDQGGAGLFMITPGSNGQPTRIEKMPIELSGAQGMLFAFDSLYAVVNGGPGSGLHRLTDSDGDGMVDKDEHCMHLNGGGEHGPHAVILAPDGKSLYVCSGNHTKLPAKIADSRIPQNWQEDHVLPRRWDANGHAVGILAPGGWICNVDPSGKNWVVHSMGYRNEYDIAFNADGELFSYDADMEWDFGSPWYRPTRVTHATSGSEFGWRSGTGKWPEYYEDSLPAAVNIGPGSPVGITFGYGAKFPAKYQQALFILDWTYSTIYSVQLTPQGSSYTGKFEDFVTGTPLPVTDAVIGTDGAMYFAIGGRGTQSAVYRVSYVGKESTEPAKLTTSGADQRQVRLSLEKFHGSEASKQVTETDMQLIMKHLGDADRFTRYAARIALEFQPASKWRDQVLKLTEPRATIAGLLALARQGEAKDLDPIATKLLQLPHENLDDHSKLAALRTLQVAIARRAESGTSLSPAVRQQVLSLLESVYPTGSYPIDAEMVQLLVKLESSVVVQRTLAMMNQLGKEPAPDWGYLVSRNQGYGGTVGKMLEDMPPARGIHFAFVLRNAKKPWTLDQRKQYFQFLIDAAKKPGGASYGNFLNQFRDDAIATCSDAEKVVLDDLINRSLTAPPIESTPPKGPGRKWTTAEAVAELGEKLTKRDHAAGRNLYHATSCGKCHRLAGEGGAIGPDLSTAGKKFSMTDMMDAILLPSKAISDQYGSHQILTSDGKTLVGRVVELENKVHVYTIDANAKPIVLAKEDIEQMTVSKVSQMPEGLIDTLSSEELKDLMAYIMAAGDKRNAVYK
jgi:putative heme-binding domain-containing protein